MNPGRVKTAGNVERNKGKLEQREWKEETRLRKENLSTKENKRKKDARETLKSKCCRGEEQENLGAAAGMWR